MVKKIREAASSQNKKCRPIFYFLNEKWNSFIPAGYEMCVLCCYCCTRSDRRSNNRHDTSWKWM